jgi:hypothetical protein
MRILQYKNFLAYDFSENHAHPDSIGSKKSLGASFFLQ